MILLSFPPLSSFILPVCTEIVSFPTRRSSDLVVPVPADLRKVPRLLNNALVPSSPAKFAMTMEPLKVLSKREPARLIDVPSTRPHPSHQLISYALHLSKPRTSRMRPASRPIFP